jgi:peptidoglycan/LPS O-acetylase OafA/YrhL
MMLLGIVVHAAASYTMAPLGAAWPFRDSTRSALLDAVFFGIHAFRMPLFFLMAGFFGALLYGRRGARGMVTNRFHRVLVPLIAAWLIVLPFARAGFEAAARVPRTEAGFTFGYPVARWLLQRNLAHLWFLYDLLFLYAAALIVAPMWPRIIAVLGGTLRRVFRTVGASALAPIVWALPTMLTLLLMPRGVVVTSTSLRPDARVLLTYGVFFAFGWALHAHADQLAAWPRRAWPFTIAGALLLLPYLVLIGGGAPWSPRHVAAAATGALIAWLMAFGITGLALRYLNRPIPTIRYLSDASYWMYLVHLPLVIWTAALLRGVAAPAVVKAMVTIAAVVPLLLASYRYGVRSTVIGEWLNGRRLPTGAGP